MKFRRPSKVLWLTLARGIPFASIMLLAACSVSVPREGARNSSDEGKAIASVAERSSARTSPAPQAMSVERIVTSATPEATAAASSTRSTLYFSDNEATLDEASESLLRQFAEYLRKNPKRRVVLKAYLDNLGSRSYSLAILQRRLDAVTAALREKGVQRSRIRQVMLGQRGKKPGCETPLCLERRNSIELQYK